MIMDNISISVIGAGKLGSTLALALAGRGYIINGLCDEDPESLKETAGKLNSVRSGTDPIESAKGSDIVILAVPDDGIRPLSDRLASAKALSKGQILCHCSGFLPSSVLVANKMLGASVASMHPLASFSEKHADWQRYAGIFFGIEGDAAAMGRVRQMVEILGCHPVDILPEKKALYHLSGVMASNYLLVLLHATRELMGPALSNPTDIDAMLTSLAGTVLDNASRHGLDASFSGPIERGDVKTVAGHLEALKKNFPQSEEPYKMLGRMMLEIVRQRHPGMKELEVLAGML
jgi:predicted short-subunit dehydrogenase-like oxidoreductase (DUF2520 family)